MPKKKFGGKQIGAGRPKGSVTKPRLSDYLTEKEVQTLVKKAMEMAAAGNDNMLKFILDHHFGKALQPVENEVKGNITVSFDNAFNETS